MVSHCTAYVTLFVSCMLDPLYFGHMPEDGLSVVVGAPVLVGEGAAEGIAVVVGVDDAIVAAVLLV